MTRRLTPLFAAFDSLICGITDQTNNHQSVYDVLRERVAKQVSEDLQISHKKPKMKKHVKIFMDANGYDPGDFIPCKGCGCRAVDIHHLERRGMGGRPSADTPDNLVALCRECHLKAEAYPEFNETLKP